MAARVLSGARGDTGPGNRMLVDDEASVESYTPKKPTTVKKKEDWKEKLLVPVVFITFVLIRAMDRIFLYRVQKSMADYTAVVMSLYWPPMVQLMCFLVALMYVARKRFSDGDKSYNMSWFSPFSERASTQGAVPQLWIAQFAFWDQLNAIISAPPGPFIPMVLQTPLNNTVVLFTGLISYFYLKTRYKQVHYAGIVLIVASCLVGVLVELQGPAPILCSGLHAANDALEQPLVAMYISEETKWVVGNATDDCVIGLPPYKDSSGEVIYIDFSTLALMYGLYILAIIPSAYSNCYKQKKLKQVNLDVMWSFFWSGMWQVAWGLLLYPLSWMPWPTPTGHNEASPSRLGQDLADSWTCFMGTNPKPSVTTCAEDPAWVWFMVYLLFNVFFNLFFLWLIKRLSGTWAAIGSILCGNLCGVFSQFELFAGPSAAKLTLEQWTALALSSIAMWVYNIEDEVDIHGNSVYGEADKGDHRYDTHGTMGLDPDSDEHDSEDEPNAKDHTVF
mmetsp:Transcript_99741/g.257713  ORF Transcript_99741/g.257713 Transcript_99741/m.257713 type:complete len:504 (+) Transcript_99741:78-1589(+)